MCARVCMCGYPEIATALNTFTLAIDNGVGITPPMGWRSWNCFHGNVNQQVYTVYCDIVELKVPQHIQVNSRVSPEVTPTNYQVKL